MSGDSHGALTAASSSQGCRLSHLIPSARSAPSRTSSVSGRDRLHLLQITRRDASPSPLSVDRMNLSSVYPRQNLTASVTPLSWPRCAHLNHGMSMTWLPPL